MSDREENDEEEIITELQQQLASVNEMSSQTDEKNKLLKAKIEQLKHIKTIVRTHGAVPAASLPLDTLHLIRELAPAIFENNIDWSGATKVQESFIKNIELSIYINLIDEDGEVLQLQTTKNEETSHLFHRYVCHQGTPFLLSQVMYEFRFNGKLIPLNVTIGSIVVAGDDNVVIYVTTKVPNRNAFNNRIVPNIPAFVNNLPHYFINQRLSVEGGEYYGTVRDCSNKDGGRFFIEWVDGTTNKRTATSADGIQQYEIDEFTVLLQDNYSSDSSGYTWDVILFLKSLVKRHESQVEQLDDGSLYTPNTILLRIIKIKQQIHRLLNYINECIEKEGKGVDLFSRFTDRLSNALSSLADKKRSHLSHTYIHKVNKPLLEPEEVVRVKQWNDETLEYSWEKGTIRSYTEHEGDGGYGFRRVYSVEFNNGECRSDVEDYHVIPDENYTNKSWESSIGINRVFDNDSLDPWAGEVGWYTVELDGVEEPFVYLTDANRAINAEQVRVRIYQKYQVEFGMLQSIDRLSDPIMRRICRVLIQLEESISVKSGLIWKTAQGHWNDSHITQMRDSVYNLALLKQSKIFSSESVDFDQVCRFFISSEGCLDTFLLKVPIFREGYDSTVLLDKKGLREDSLSRRRHDMMRYLGLYNKPDDADDFMSIKFVDGTETERYTMVRNAPLKQLLTKYTTSRGLSIKSLRIKHNERTLFLSSIGKKTPEELSIEDGDVIVIIMQSTPTEATNEQTKPKQHNTKKGKNKKKHKKSKKKRAQPLVIQKTEVELKVEHSKLLGKVYEEAEPTFKEIRQRLNAMNLERTKPKQRTSPTKATKPVEVVDNPLSNDQLLGGKAGRTQFIIQVGEVSNLYKTTKPSSAGRGRRQDDIMIDLHGLTAEEAVYRLDKHLPSWIETAMKGTYPFVIPVKIICGGGSQILAEVVENWIKQNDHVANAPKNMYS